MIIQGICALIPLKIYNTFIFPFFVACSGHSEPLMKEYHIFCKTHCFRIFSIIFNQNFSKNGYYEEQNIITQPEIVFFMIKSIINY